MAVEPVRENLLRIVASLRFNGLLGRVQLFPAALGNSTHGAAMGENEDNQGGVRHNGAQKGGSGITLPIVALDRLLDPPAGPGLS